MTLWSFLNLVYLIVFVKQSFLRLNPWGRSVIIYKVRMTNNEELYLGGLFEGFNSSLRFFLRRVYDCHLEGETAS